MINYKRKSDEKDRPSEMKWKEQDGVCVLYDL